jgi:hypothetical protein
MAQPMNDPNLDLDSVTDSVDSGTEILNVSDCWALIRSAEVARLAVCVNDQPDIFPINYVVDHGTVVFRSAPGTKLSAATGNAVALEVDGVDSADSATGHVWSVVVKGTAEVLTEILGVFEATGLPLFPWQASPKPMFVRIEPAEITGRRFRRVDPATASENIAARPSGSYE